MDASHSSIYGHGSTPALTSKYQDNLPGRIREYLACKRGISGRVISQYHIGWNGQRITIPITDREGNIACFKLAKDPADAPASPKMLFSPGARAELYGWERVLARPEQIIICEGEFDRLVLESQGFAAVTSTGGAGTFRLEWSVYFVGMPSIYICFDNDDAGRHGANRVAGMIPHARLVRLPDEVGEGGDVTDFFVRLGRGPDDFRRLLDVAEAPIPQTSDARPRVAKPADPAVVAAVLELKSRVGITDLVGRYLSLRWTGERCLAQCPFHEDRTPSFVLYPQTGTFHCFGCRAHGDVITFLMRLESLSFREAVSVLRNFRA
jgi:DNA primase